MICLSYWIAVLFERDSKATSIQYEWCVTKIKDWSSNRSFNLWKWLLLFLSYWISVLLERDCIATAILQQHHFIIMVLAKIRKIGAFAEASSNNLAVLLERDRIETAIDLIEFSGKHPWCKCKGQFPGNFLIKYKICISNDEPISWQLAKSNLVRNTAGLKSDRWDHQQKSHQDSYPIQSNSRQLAISNLVGNTPSINPSLNPIHVFIHTYIHT